MKFDTQESVTINSTDAQTVAAPGPSPTVAPVSAAQSTASYVASRLTEPSTWAGIGMLATLLFPEASVANIHTAAAVIPSLLSIFLPENTGK